MSQIFDKLNYIRNLFKYEKHFADPFQNRKIIDEIFRKVKFKNNFIIDIGASNGSESNTYFLFKKGNYGIAIEPDSYKFSILSYEYMKFNINLFKMYATPGNIINILKSCNTPEEPKFLNLDIDSYDYFVLESILKEYKPTLICAEINESIPPPFQFMVLYNPNFIYFSDHFYGMSIAAIENLCNEYSYDIVDLNYINVFLIQSEKNPFPKLSSEKAYNKGYKNRIDRKNKFPWNRKMEKLFTLNIEEGRKFIENTFSKYKNQYNLIV